MLVASGGRPRDRQDTTLAGCMRARLGTPTGTSGVGRALMESSPTRVDHVQPTAWRRIRRCRCRFMLVLADRDPRGLRDRRPHESRAVADRGLLGEGCRGPICSRSRSTRQVDSSRRRRATATTPSAGSSSTGRASRPRGLTANRAAIPGARAVRHFGHALRAAPQRRQGILVPWPGELRAARGRAADGDHMAPRAFSARGPICAVCRRRRVRFRVSDLQLSGAFCESVRINDGTPTLSADLLSITAVVSHDNPLMISQIGSSR